MKETRRGSAKTASFVDACFWFRRDLRLEDNIGLAQILQDYSHVLGVFVFDQEILSRLQDSQDARVTFIYDRLVTLKKELQKQGGDLLVVYGDVEEEWQKIIDLYEPEAIYTNRDFEPYARVRDPKIQSLAEKNDCVFKTFVDHVIFEPGEITKSDGNPYLVYTPFSKQWLQKFESIDLAPKRIERGYWAQISIPEMPSLESLGFDRNSQIDFPSNKYSRTQFDTYGNTRDLPAVVGGTSRLGVHLRFGTISIRQLAREAAEAKDLTFLKELIWREFFIHLLWFYPKTPKTAFKEQYDHIPWRTGRDADRDFERWCQGHTGYPMVDAGMRELNQTGYMHNRVRMVVASFLCKHLLIDWRRGERYFAEKLLDYELASNVGNWQWAAGSGADAAPYFRIFNPYTQREKFDPDWDYVSQWVPEYDSDEYVNEVVDYKEGRERALRVYKDAVG